MIAATTRRWLSAFPAEKSVVMLHPGFTGQHILLDTALRDHARTPLLLTLRPPCDTLEEFWAQLAGAMQDQLDLSLPALDAKWTVEKAVQAILKALHPVDPFILFIDAVDVAKDNVKKALVAFATALPASSQIVLGTRQLCSIMLGSAALRGKLALYPCDPERMLIDYISQPSDRDVLEVYGLGPGHALINGQRIDRWDGILPRSLFFYFIDRGMVTRDEIFSTFWPSLSVREATNVFHVTKRKISEILGFDLTVYWSGFYRISPDIDLHYDVVKFIEDVQNSVVADERSATELLERAIFLYRGLFLGTLDMEWAASRRSELKLTYADALSTLGRLRQRAGETQEALGLYLRASTTQPQREDLARGIMSLYASLGQSDKAIGVFNRLTDELKENLGVGPDRQTAELAEQIRKR